MFANLKTQLHEPPYFRDTIDEEVTPYYGLGWMVDFSPDSVINTALRKENILDFAMANEGNVYNSIFFKVQITKKDSCQSQSSNTYSFKFQVDKLLKENCESNGEYCQFNQRFLSFLRTLPSKSGYNEFSVFLSGKLSQNAEVEWIAMAIRNIFGYL